MAEAIFGVKSAKLLYPRLVLITKCLICNLFLTKVLMRYNAVVEKINIPPQFYGLKPVEWSHPIKVGRTKSEAARHGFQAVDMESSD